MPYRYLYQINDPTDLKHLNTRELEEYSKELCHFIQTVIEEIGGHYSSPLGVVDLTIALHYVYNSPEDKLVWDVGHQAYAHKIITGRRDRFSTLRKKGGISGFLKRDESPHDIIGAGHASTAISSALGIAHARDRLKGSERVVAIVGDGALTGGLSYEGMNNLGFHRTQLTVVLNDNSLSISPSVGALSGYLTRVLTHPAYNKIRNDIWNVTGKIPTFPSKFIRKFLRKTEEGIKGFFTPGALFEELGLRYVGPIDGHNLDLLIQTFDSVKNFPNPTLVHVYTKKGRGSELAESDSVKYYSLRGKENAETVKPAPDYSEIFGRSIRDIAIKEPDIICITAAMGIGTGLSKYVNEFKERYIDVGIAEGHAITYASGLSSAGLLPVVAIYSTFIQRAYDNIFHDILLQDLPAIICLDRAGIVGPDGPTHHGVFDIPLLRMLPGIILSAPSTGDEFYDLLHTAVLERKPFAIRYPKDTSFCFNPNRKPDRLTIGSWEIVNQGKSVAVIATGSMVEVAKRALPKIKQELDINPTIINARFIKPFDAILLADLTQSHSRIITMEEGALQGGFGSSIIEYLNSSDLNISVHRMGIPDHFIEQGTRQELLDDLKLNIDGLMDELRKL